MDSKSETRIDIKSLENEEIHFIQKRPKSSSRPQRPLSLASQIISNPKLVKSLQDLGEGRKFDRSDRSRYVSIARIDSKYGDEQDVNNIENTGCQRYIGIFLALLASLSLSLSSIIVKSISTSYHPYSISVWTFQGIFIPSLVVLIVQTFIKKEKVFQGIIPLCSKMNIKNQVFLIIRALLGAGGTVLKIYSLQFMTAADSTVITFSAPVFVVVIAWIFLDEKCGVVPIVTALFVLVGIGIIFRPPWITGEKEFDTQLLIGCSMAFTCMLLGTFTVVILRYLKDVHFALITFIYGLIGTLVSLSLCFVVGSFQWPTCLKHWLFAIAVAQLTFVGHSTLTMALKYELAGPIALVRTTEIIFTFGWQLLFFHLLPDLLGLVGALIVITGVFIITIRKWISTLPLNHGARNYCRLLLI